MGIFKRKTNKKHIRRRFANEMHIPERHAIRMRINRQRARIAPGVAEDSMPQCVSNNNNQQSTDGREFLKKISEILCSKGKCTNYKQDNNDDHRGPKGGGCGYTISLQDNNDSNRIIVR